MKISLIHPSRGRALKSASTAREWRHKCGTECEYILSTDQDDDHQYYHAAHGLNVMGFNKHIVSENSSVVEATNRAAKESTGDILIYLSDDFKCPDNWGQLVINEFKKYSGPTLIKVDDMLQHFNTKVLTIPMMNRDLYDKLKYFWHPEYKSMFVDEDLYWTTEKIGALKFAPHLKFPHEHVSNGKAQDDETYRRSAANWNQGKETFFKRKAAGFPL